MSKFKKLLKPIGIIGLLLASIMGGGCTADEQPPVNPPLGEIFDPTGNPFAHRFTDEGVTTSGTPADNDYAKFTDDDTIEGRSYAELLADISREDSDINTLITATKLDDLTAPDDNTDLNASTSTHGLLFKLGGGTTNFLRADGTWAAPGAATGARSVTVIVAANDATAAEKAGADYTCDTVNDEVQIAAAMSASNGGIVMLSSGTFEVEGGAELVINDCTLRGQGDGRFGTGGTTLELGGNSDTMRIQEGGKLQDCYVEFPAGYTGIAVLVKSAVGQEMDRQNRILDGLHVACPTVTNRTGTACRIESSIDDAYIELCHFGSLIVEGASVGLHLYCAEDDGEYTFINGNIFDSVIAVLCTTEIKLERAGTGTPDIVGNIFNMCIVHGYATGVTDGLRIGTGCHYNQFNNFFAWDSSNFSGYPVICEATSSYNTVVGHFGTDISKWSDLGRNFILETQLSPTIRFRYINLGSGVYSGEIRYGTAGEALSEHDLCYLTSGKFSKADADAEATAKGQLVIAMEDIANDALGRFLVKGWCGKDSWGLTTGAPVFMSTTAGDYTQTAPSGSGDIIRVVGWADYTSEGMRFDPSPDWYEHDGTGISKINGIAIHI